MTMLLWLRSDLRLDDHEALARACDRAEHLVAVAPLDPRLFDVSQYGPLKTGPHRARFWLESLADLRAAMRARGGELVVRVGSPAEVVPALARETGAQAVFAHTEPMPEEAADEAAVRAALPGGVPLETVWGHTLVHIDDLPMAVADLPRVFTEWRKRVEARCPIRPPLGAPARLPPPPDGLDAGRLPTLADLGLPEPADDPRAALRFRGGEAAGRARLHAYLWDEDRLREYKKTRNGLLGAGYSTKLSPWLAMGCLSPRRVHAETKRYEAERVANESTYWLVFELLWRDFFRFYGAKHGARLFAPGGPSGRVIDWRDPTTDEEAADDLRVWASGETGLPFIDAAMREMNATGFLSNRMRQNVASLLTKNLNLDWRHGAAVFEGLLVDHDVTSNWGNWAYNAGVGADPRDRYFNLAVQARQYDESGAYVRTWLPELAGLPREHVHAPWRLNKAALQRAGVQLGHDYPRPMLDLERSYAEIRGAR